MSPLTPHAVGVEEGLDMGTIHVNLIKHSNLAGTDAPDFESETHEAFLGVPGTGPTGVRTRSQWSQSGVMDGLGLRHWELFTSGQAAARG